MMPSARSRLGRTRLHLPTTDGRTVSQSDYAGENVSPARTDSKRNSA